MKITDCRVEVTPEYVNASAAVIWEESSRPTERLFFRVPAQFGERLSLNPNAFLVGAAIPAMYYGESRIHIDEEVSPDLIEGLSTAMSILQYWNAEDNKAIPTIEARVGQNAVFDTVQRKSGLFFSGGIDSYSALVRNRQVYPETHPRYIRDAILVFGLEMEDPQAFTYVERRLAPVAEAYGLTFIPAYTNVYLMYRDDDRKRGFPLWKHYFGGASFAAIAHFLAGRIHTITFAASNDIPHLGFWGTDPLLDPNFGSFDLTIRHEGIELSRLQKTRMIASDPLLLEHLRVCNRFSEYRDTRLNCGRCEKCIRTMLALIAIGKLGDTSAFENKELTAKDVRRVAHIASGDEMVASSYLELIEPLTAVGRGDLASAVRGQLAEFRRANGLWGSVEKRVKVLRRFVHRSYLRMKGARSEHAIAGK